MVLVKQLEGEYGFLKQNITSEPTKCDLGPLRGIKTPLCRLGTLADKGGGACETYLQVAEEEQSLLDALLLARWEACAWKGLLKFDVTNCEMKVIPGGNKFIVQLNEKWNPTALSEVEKNVRQQLGHFESNFTQINGEYILLCVAQGEKESSELISLSTVPRDGTLIIINKNPIEYGDVLLVPYGSYCKPDFLEKRSLELVAQITAEINSCSFRVYCDYVPAKNPEPLRFQANYFASTLPAEAVPLVPLYGDNPMKMIVISELVDYPVKALVFDGRNLKLLVGIVIDICGVLTEQDNPFSLLISDRGTRFVLFPQIQTLTGRNLSAWECGGYFVWNSAVKYDHASEVEISNQMSAVSFDNQRFQALKQLSCSIANKHVLQGGKHYG